MKKVIVLFYCLLFFEFVNIMNGITYSVCFGANTKYVLFSLASNKKNILLKSDNQKYKIANIKYKNLVIFYDEYKKYMYIDSIPFEKKKNFGKTVIFFRTIFSQDGIEYEIILEIGSKSGIIIDEAYNIDGKKMNIYLEDVIIANKNDFYKFKHFYKIDLSEKDIRKSKGSDIKMRFYYFDGTFDLSIGKKYSNNYFKELYECINNNEVVKKIIRENKLNVCDLRYNRVY